MHYRSSLSELPLSLLITSLALAAIALPVHTTQLTPDNFKDTTATGLWFIEHYSPYCGHCRDFAPTWDKLVETTDKNAPSVHLAQVNCAIYGDFCTESGIKGYPTLTMYKDGHAIEKYNGNRKLDNLEAFIGRHVEQATLAEPEVARAIINTEGGVLDLTSESFPHNLAKGPMFVKFFAPWCGHCKKLAPIWKQLGRHMQNKLTIGQVNCDDHGALCKSHGVQGYPTLIYLSEGGLRSEYNGGRKLEQLKSFAEKASSAGLQPIKSQELDTIVAENDVVYLLLHSPSDTAILNTVRKAASPLLGSPPIFTCAEPTLLAQFSIPQTSTWALVALKDNDSNIPSAIIHERISSEHKLRTWLLSHRLSTTVELTQDTFQSVMSAPQEPLVVIAAVTKDNKEKVKERFKEVGKKWRVRTSGSGVIHDREIVFAWMDRDRWADWMKSMYGIAKDSQSDETLDGVRVIISDHKRLIFYDKDLSDARIKLTSSSNLFAAIEAAASGKLTYKNSENFIERMARYLNHKMTSIEAYIATYPFRALLFLLAFFVLLFLGLKRIISDDLPVDYRAAKADRLD